MSTPIICCTDLSYAYCEGNNRTEVLKGISLEITPGMMLALVGSSGSGKSTLLHLLGALDRPTSGDIQVNGRSVLGFSAKEQAHYRNTQLGFIYQFHHLLGDFTALENVAMPLLIGGKPRKQATNLAQQLLDRVGLSHRYNHLPGELSGGERQRVAIARALVNQPQLVLADEPTGNLDAHSAELIYTLLRELNQELGMAFLVVTHDQQLAARLDRHCSLVDGHLQGAQQ